jgi:hypothetical protein
MSTTIRMIGCAVALAATASLGPAKAQQSQAWTWCTSSEANGVSLDLKISSFTTVIQSGNISNRNLALAYGSRGNAYRAKGQLDHAIQDYDQAIIFNPYSKTLTGLTCPSVQDETYQDDDGDDDESLEERWTPRFRNEPGVVTHLNEQEARAIMVGRKS